MAIGARDLYGATEKSINAQRLLSPETFLIQCTTQLESSYDWYSLYTYNVGNYNSTINNGHTHIIY